MLNSFRHNKMKARAVVGRREEGPLGDSGSELLEGESIVRA